MKKKYADCLVSFSFLRRAYNTFLADNEFFFYFNSMEICERKLDRIWNRTVFVVGVAGLKWDDQY